MRAPNEIYTEYARTLIRVRVRRLVREKGFLRSEQDDLEQELVMHLISQAPSFDSSRASLNTFVATVVDSGVAMIVRDRNRTKRMPTRGASTLSLETKVDRPGSQPKTLRDIISLDDQTRRTGASQSTDVERFVHTDDVHTALASLPPQLQEFCKSLQLHGCMETRSLLGLSRRGFDAALESIREHFLQNSLAEKGK